MRLDAKRAISLILAVVLVAMACPGLAEEYAEKIENGEDDMVLPLPDAAAPEENDDNDEGKGDETSDGDAGHAPSPDGGNRSDDLEKNDKSESRDDGETPETPQATREPEDAPHKADEETNPETGNTNETVKVERIVVSISKGTLTPGETARATCAVYPENASADVSWSSSDESVAVVSKNGVVRIPDSARIRESGEYVDIWAKANDGSLAMNCQTILVLPNVTGIKLFLDDTTVRAGDDAPFMIVYVDVQPQSLFGVSQIKWQSSDPKVAAIKAEGQNGEAATIIWFEPGEAVISAYSNSNPDCRDSMKLTVLPPMN